MSDEQQSHADQIKQLQDNFLSLLADIESMTPAEILMWFNKFVDLNNQLTAALEVRDLIIKSQETSLETLRLMIEAVNSSTAPSENVMTKLKGRQQKPPDRMQ